MDAKEKKSLSVYLIALAVILSNLAVFSVVYRVPFLADLPLIRKALPYFSMTAVYPFDFFRIYFKEDVWMHFYWILCVTLSGFGLLLFNQFSRIVFIVFNIINLVVLGLIAIFHFGQVAFWGYFFKWYFNMVAFLIYVGYLTLAEIRTEFNAAKKDSQFSLFFLKMRRGAVGAKDAQGYFNLGLAYHKLGRTEEAVDFLNRAIEILPTKAEFHFHLGQLMLDTHNFSEAIKLLKNAVRFDPLNGQARYLLGITYEKTGCLEEAVHSFRRASFLELQRADVFQSLGIACYRAGYWEEAVLALQRAMELDPVDYLSCYYIGLIMLKNENDAKDAEEYFKKCVRLKPDFGDGYKELGNLYVQRGEYKNAVRAFRDVLRIEGGQKEAHYQLGFAYAMMKDFESARREYQYLKNVDPDLAQTLAMLLR